MGRWSSERHKATAWTFMYLHLRNLSRFKETRYLSPNLWVISGDQHLKSKRFHRKQTKSKPPYKTISVHEKSFQREQLSVLGQCSQQFSQQNTANWSWAIQTIGRINHTDRNLSGDGSKWLVKIETFDLKELEDNELNKSMFLWIELLRRLFTRNPFDYLQKNWLENVYENLFRAMYKGGSTANWWRKRRYQSED